MALLQQVAARLAGLDELCFYVFNDEGAQAFARSTALLAGPLAAESGVESWLARVEAHGFVWGRGDGNLTPRWRGQRRPAGHSQRSTR